MSFTTILGDVLREERHYQRRTMRDVSAKASIALGYLSEVERGQKQLSTTLLENLAKALYVMPSQLILEVGVRMAKDEIPDTAESLDVPENQAPKVVFHSN
jgi:hypothetical protein